MLALNPGKATVAPRAAVATNAWNPQKVQVPHSVAEYNTERPPFSMVPLSATLASTRWH